MGMEHALKLELPLIHRVEVSEAAHYLLHELACDNWYVACRREHLLVLHFDQRHQPKYAVTFDCTPPVEKGIYHGTKACSVRIIPLHGQAPLPEERLHQIQAGLSMLT
jgi:hypothetical protein